MIKYRCSIDIDIIIWSEYRTFLSLKLFNKMSELYFQFVVVGLFCYLFENELQVCLIVSFILSAKS